MWMRDWLEVGGWPWPRTPRLVLWRASSNQVRVDFLVNQRTQICWAGPLLQWAVGRTLGDIRTWAEAHRLTVQRVTPPGEEG